MSSEDTAAPTDSMEELALADARPQSLEMRREEPPNWGWDEEFYHQRKPKGCSLVRRQVPGNVPHHH